MGGFGVGGGSGIHLRRTGLRSCKIAKMAEATARTRHPT